MTISTQDSKVNYQGNGQTTVFQIPFPFLENEQIYVQKKDVEGNLINYTYATDYTVKGAGEENGGSVTLNVAPEQGSTISIYRDVPLTQEVDYRENEIFPAETHEAALDKLTMEVQQIQEQLDRSVKVDRFSDVDPDIIVREIERVYDSTDNIDIVANNIDSVNTTTDNITNVNIVSDNISNVNVVADINADVTNVSAIKDDVSTVSSIKDNVVTVAGIAQDVTDVAGIKDNVSTVANDSVNVDIVAANITDVNTVAGISQNVSTVASISGDVTSVSDLKADIVNVSSISTQVKAVGDNINGVTNVADNMSSILKVEGNEADIKTVAGMEQQVKDVSANMDAVIAVSDDLANINTVAANDAAVKAVGDNIDVVLKAPDYANSSKVWAEGTDEEVAQLGGVHSAEEWAKIAGQVAQVDVASETTTGIVRLATADEAESGVIDSAAMTPLKTKYVVEDYTGKGLQLGFNGTLEGSVLTFTPDTQDYVLKQGYDYEIDLLFPAVGILPDDTQIIIKNGTDTIQIVNVRHADANTSITYSDMKQICRYDVDVGWRWVFNARYAVTDTGVNVFVMPSYAFQDSRYVTTDTAQNITSSKNFINNATSTTPDAHTGMSLCLKNEDAELGADTQNEDGSVNFKYQGIRVVDKNNEEISSLYSAPDGVGGSFTRMSASAKVDGQYVNGFVELEVDANGKTHFYVPEVDTDSTVNGTQAVTKNYVDGDQVITGTKTIQAENIRPELHMNSNTTVVSGSTTFAGSIVQKLNNTPIGYIESGSDVDGSHFTQIVATYKVNGVDTYANSCVAIDSSGNSRAYAPVGSVSDSGLEVATAAYINTKFQVVSALPASPNTNIFYFIPE